MGENEQIFHLQNMKIGRKGTSHNNSYRGKSNEMISIPRDHRDKPFGS